MLTMSVPAITLVLLKDLGAHKYIDNAYTSLHICEKKHTSNADTIDI